MNWRNRLGTIRLLTLIILTTACSSPDIVSTVIPSTTAATVIPPTQNIPTTGIDGTLCDHAYFPVREGATWTYQSTGSLADDYRYTEIITAVSPDGFIVTTEYEKYSRTHEWACLPEGLRALELTGPIVATLQTQSIQLNIRPQSIQGINLPREFTSDSAWQRTLEFEGDMLMAGEQATATGISQEDFQLLGMESVTVPAGTFEAMKVRVDTLFTLNILYKGLEVPASYTSTYTYWFAPGVGWVKATGNADIAGQSFTENIELQSYKIP